MKTDKWVKMTCPRIESRLSNSTIGLTDQSNVYDVVAFNTYPFDLFGSGARIGTWDLRGGWLFQFALQPAGHR